nr:hypothetical protein [Tanacetum cinerariifolium]
AANNSGPIFDYEPLEKVDHDDDDDLANEQDLLASLIQKLKFEIDDNKNRNKFLETPNKALVNKLKSKTGDFKTKNKSLESSNNHFKEANNELSKTNQLMFNGIKKFQAELDRYNDVREQVDHDDDDDLANEQDLLASLIQKLKFEIDDNKNRNKFLETPNKALVNKLKSKTGDFKTKNKSLESSNNHFKEANNELSKTNQLMFNGIKKFQAELDRYNDVRYASKV